MFNSTQVEPGVSQATLEESARLLVTRLDFGDFEAVTDSFDPYLKGMLSSNELAEGWRQVEAAVGTFRQRGKERVTRVPPYYQIEISCYFDSGVQTVRIVFNRDGTVSGLFIAPELRSAGRTE